MIRLSYIVMVGDGLVMQRTRPYGIDQVLSEYISFSPRRVNSLKPNDTIQYEYHDYHLSKKWINTK